MAHLVAGLTAYQAVGGADRAAASAIAAAPGGRAGIHDSTVIPVRAVHDVIATGGARQLSDSIAHCVAGLAAHQAVGRADRAAAAAIAAAPGDCTGIHDSTVIPVIASYHVMAVAQGGNVAHPVVGRTADQAVGGADRAAAAAGAAAPGGCPGVHGAPVIPVKTFHHVITIVQGDDTTAHPVVCLAAHQAVGRADRAAAAVCPAAPGDCPGIHGAPVIPFIAAHHVIAAAQDSDAASAHLVAGRAAGQAADQGQAAAVV